MALSKQYPADFERLWKAYPKWPTGRSKKEPSYKAFAKAKKDLGFGEKDIEAIEADIEKRKRDCVTWQRGNPYGPVMFATYINQHLWNEPYERVRAPVHNGSSGEDVWKKMGYADFDAYCRGERLNGTPH